MKKFTVKIKDKVKLTSFLKKMSLINPNFLMEIKPNDYVKSKNFNEEHTIIRNLSIQFNDIFEIDQSKTDLDINELMFAGIYNISKMITYIGFVKNDDIITFNFDENLKQYESANKDIINYYDCISLIISNKSLKFSLPCASFKLFNYISDSEFEILSSTEDMFYEFNISNDDMSNILKLLGTDTESEFLNIHIINNPEQEETDIIEFNTLDWSFKNNIPGIGDGIPEDIMKEQNNIKVQIKNIKLLESDEYRIQILSNMIILSKQKENGCLVISTISE